MTSKTDEAEPNALRAPCPHVMTLNGGVTADSSQRPSFHEQLMGAFASYPFLRSWECTRASMRKQVDRKLQGSIQSLQNDHTYWQRQALKQYRVSQEVMDWIRCSISHRPNILPKNFHHGVSCGHIWRSFSSKITHTWVWTLFEVLGRSFAEVSKSALLGRSRSLHSWARS